MTNFVGIDLGTSNSAICVYDGQKTKIIKSPEQNDVTPSVIYFDKRSKFVGKKAYDLAARSPENSALKFKRLMGTNTPIKIKSTDTVMTPEECSAEILKCCFGYLPEEIRNDPEVATVITVPAAFNQMQRDATMTAADIAGIGKVALMQEPVAAVLSEMRIKNSDGTFLIFDLGGGTLDLALATSLKGRVSIESHGGIEMCGGADFDKAILNEVVSNWLKDTFSLPEDFITNEKYKKLIRLALWASEQAKIELSSKDDSLIILNESEINLQDENGNDIYLDIPLNRNIYGKLIENKINEAIEAARETIKKAGLTSDDIDRIVFVGGPTQYKPLRDKISKELAISTSNEVNPMTAVAEGASIFAESIDWSDISRGRKSNRGEFSSGGKLNISFSFISRTPDSNSKIAIKLPEKLNEKTELQIESLDTGWSSGRIALEDKMIVDVALSKLGENKFKVTVYSSKGSPIKIDNELIIITKTAAIIDAIPSSSSIGVEVSTKNANIKSIIYMIREGDPLPKKGSLKFRANETLKAGTQNSLNFILREGELKNAEDNKIIGVFKIHGNDFELGEIQKNDELICDFEVLDSGQIKLLVSVEKLKSSFLSKENFYSRQEGQINYSQAYDQINSEVKDIEDKLDEISNKVEDSEIDKVINKISNAKDLNKNNTDPETSKQAMDYVQEAKKILSRIKDKHKSSIQQLELDRIKEFYESSVKQYARESEQESFKNLFQSAQMSIDKETTEFENIIENIRGNNWEILWREDDFVISVFEQARAMPENYADHQKYENLLVQGDEALLAKDMNKFRAVVLQFYTIKIHNFTVDNTSIKSNISVY